MAGIQLSPNNKKSAAVKELTAAVLPQTLSARQSQKAVEEWRYSLANAKPAIIGDNGNDKGGNDGGKWESTFAAPIVVVGNPSVIVLIKNAVIAVVIILSGVITSIVVGVAAFVILISVVIGGLVCIGCG